MKAKIIILIMFSSFLGLIYSCTEKETTLDELKIVEFENIGKLQSQGLEFIFHFIDSSRRNGNIDINYANFTSLAMQQSAKFVEKLAINQNEKQIILNNFDTNYSSEKQQLSTNQNLLIQTLLTVSKEFDGANSITTINKINDIESQCKILLPEEERMIILTATTVTKNLVNYYTDNMPKWRGLVLCKILEGKITAPTKGYTVVTGTVVDKETHEAMPGVVATIRDSFEGCETNTSGWFSLGTFVYTPFYLDFFYIGYKPIAFQIQGSTLLSVEMEYDLDLDFLEDLMYTEIENAINTAVLAKKYNISVGTPEYDAFISYNIIRSSAIKMIRNLY